MKFVSFAVRSLLIGVLLLAVRLPNARAQVSDFGNSTVGSDDSSNNAPTISDVQLPALVQTNDTITVSFESSDPDGDEVVAICQWTKNGVVLEGEASTALDLSVAGYGDKGDIISVVVSVSDGHGGMATSPEVAVTVQDTPPTISSVAIDNLTPYTSDLLTAKCVANDADGDVVTTTYQWKKNGQNLVGETAATLDLGKVGNGDKRDVIWVIATVSAAGATVSQQSDAVTVVNSPPTMWNNNNFSTWQGRPVMWRPGASDPDGDPLIFSATTTKPTSGVLSGIDPIDGLFLYRPSNTVGTASFPLQVSDGESIATTTMWCSITAAPLKGTQIYTALGDSTALGRGAMTSQGYSARLERMLQSADGPGGKGWRLSVRAISGFSAPDTLRKVAGQSMLSLAVADNPSVMTVWLGLNDVNRIGLNNPSLETLAELTSSYNTIISTLATKTRAKVVVADVPNIGALPFGLAQPLGVRTTLARLSIEAQKLINAAVKPTSFGRVVLLNDPGTRTNFTSGDGFHPSNNGYLLVANKMFAALVRQLEFSPQVVSVTPTGARDAVGTRRSFQLVVSDANGASTLTQLELLLNTKLDMNSGAYLLYSPQTRLLSLKAGRTWLGPIRTGTRANPKEILDNGLVRIVGRDVVITLSADGTTLSADGTTLSADGTTLSVSIPITSNTKLVGSNTIFVRVKDSTGRTAWRALPREVGYVRAGTYTVLPVKGR
ncbi:hypothetical protein EON83_19435 [bacterium]|nr:MAG: hypothetical protein EON83_19435 [bacterium]